MFYRILCWIILLCLSFSESLFASLLPVPQLTPQSAPVVHQIRDKKWRNLTQKKIENTPAAEWQMIRKGKSIDVYSDGSGQIFIQKIVIGSTTRITSIFDFDHYDEDSGEPLYTKFSPWDKIKKLQNPPLSFINGQFFDPRRKYTPFSFGFKLNDTILTAGSDNQKEEKNIFSISSSGARVIPYSWENLRDEHADFALVNLSMNQPHESNFAMGRTYICTISPDANGYSKTLFTFTFLAATESYAADILHSWGCQDRYTSKLDSSGSSIFWFEKNIYYGYAHKGSPDYRKIPQIIAFYE